MIRERGGKRAKDPSGLRFWLLDENGEAVECDYSTWENWLEASGQRLIQQETIEGYFVSTVFVGCGHRFETMIFNPDGQSIWESRSETKAEALFDHEHALRAVDNKEFEPESSRL